MKMCAHNKNRFDSGKYATTNHENINKYFFLEQTNEPCLCTCLLTSQSTPPTFGVCVCVDVINVVVVVWVVVVVEVVVEMMVAALVCYLAGLQPSTNN